MEEKALALVNPEELALVENNALNARQLEFVLKKTPAKYIRKRPAKGGGQWSYVSGGYVKKMLNLVFGWDWSFRVKEYKYDLEVKQAFVLGELTVKTADREITKMQFGRVDIKFRNELAYNDDGTPKMAKTRDGKEYQAKEPGKQPLDLGNDLKAATTDSLKKCASELGIAADIYNAEEFREIAVDTNKVKEYTEILTDTEE
jgi:recombination DNA repair RAD52 pathway protein